MIEEFRISVFAQEIALHTLFLGQRLDKQMGRVLKI